MSCITEILKVKGDKEFLVVPDMEMTVAIEGGGKYKNYEYLITISDWGIRCGYVAIPYSHPTFNSTEEYPDFNVHGGITFFGEPHLSEPILKSKNCNDKWLGFDAGHSHDQIDKESALKAFNDFNFIEDINNFIKDEKLKGIDYMKFKHGKIRTYEFMEKECHNLIEQLIDKE